ncbi:histidine phosphatase family protein [Catenulispora subtropica]|uniref:Phosphoglycerate mutase n=1 Tax=Catenulispora subtropica TaxID=450798 RepID=A0ABN2RGN3_9ACTN
MAVFLVQHADKVREPGDPGITARGREHAARTASWAHRVGVRRVYCSPLLRSHQTAEIIASPLRLRPIEDVRATERLNWNGDIPFEVFAAEWQRTVEDRGYTPIGGDSSFTAAARLRDLVSELAGLSGHTVIVTHGGVTVDLLRSLLGGASLGTELLIEGVPSCAITTIQDGKPLTVASVGHLI